MTGDLTSADIEAILNASPEEVSRVAADTAAAPATSAGAPAGLPTQRSKPINFLPFVAVGLLGYVATGSVKWAAGLGLAAQFMAAQATKR